METSSELYKAAKKVASSLEKMGEEYEKRYWEMQAEEARNKN